MNPDPEERRDYVYNQLDEYGRLYMNCLELFVHKLWCRQKMLFRNNKIYEEKLATISEVIGALTASDQVVVANKNESERLESSIHKINEVIYIPPPLDRNGLSLVNDLLVKEATDNFAKFHEPASYSGSISDFPIEEGPLNLNLSACNQSKATRIDGVIKGSSFPVNATTKNNNIIPKASVPLSSNNYCSLPNSNNNSSPPSLVPIVTSSSTSTSTSTSSTPSSVIKTNTSSLSAHHPSHSHHPQQHSHSHHQVKQPNQHQNHHSNGTSTSNNNGSISDNKCPSNSKRKMESENESNNHHLMRFKMGRDFELHPEDDSYVEEQITADSYEIEEDEEDDEEEEIEVDLSGNSIQSYLNNREPIGASNGNSKDLSHQRSSVLRRFRRPIVDSEIVKCCIQMGCRYLERQNANHMRKHYRSWHNDIAYPKNPYVKVDMTAEAITENLEAWMLQRKNRQQRVSLKNSEVL